MKNTCSLIALFTLISLSVHAQKIATWKGGTPGRVSDWNCPTNWKEGRVPDEFSQVIIPDVSASTFCYPVLDHGEVEVQSLTCSPGTHLTMKNKARVIVIEAATYGDQIRSGMATIFGREVRFGN